MRSTLSLALLVASVVFVGGMQAAVAQSKSLTVVKVGGTGRADQAKTELALRRGYFAEQGIDLQTVTGGATAQDYLSSVATNQIQVGAGSPNAAMMNALNRGIDLRIVADWAHINRASDTTMSIVARSELMDNGTIKSLSDLRSRTVSLGPGVGSVNEMFFDKAIASVGLKRTDMNVTMVGFGEALAAFTGGKLDAAVLIEPLIWTAERQKIGRVLATSGTFDPGAQVAVLFYSPEFAKNTDLATRFMVAYLQGIRELDDAFFERKNIDSVVDILVENLSLKDRRVWIDSPPSKTDVNGAVNVESIKAQAEFYKSTGSITGGVPDLSKVVDMRFVDAAVKQLGKR